MLTLFCLLVMTGTVILVIPKKSFKYRKLAIALGIGLVAGAIAFLLPSIIEEHIEKIKQQGVEEYFNKTYDPNSKEEIVWEERFF